MQEFNQSNATVHVYTFKEGLLSSIAHDLRIDVPDFAIEVDHQIRAEIDLRSLRVACARKEGVDAPELLSSSDHAKIERTMRDEVLHTSRYPYVVLEADLGDLADGALTGNLELHGKSGDVDIRLSDTSAGLRVEFRIHQPDFGIRAYSAMLGTLKVKPDVTIVVTLHDFSLRDLRELA